MDGGWHVQTLYTAIIEMTDYEKQSHSIPVAGPIYLLAVSTRKLVKVINFLSS